MALVYAVLKGYSGNDWNVGEEHWFDFYHTRSEDRGYTWEKPKRLELPGVKWGSPFGRIISGTDGTLLLPFYGDAPLAEFAEMELTGAREDRYNWVLRSTDNGRSWGHPTAISYGHNETALLLLPEGRLLAAMRSDGMSVAFSDDVGRTWSQPQRVTRPAEHPGDLTLLGSGDVLLTYGQRNYPYGVQAKVSRDGGRSWEPNEAVVLVQDSANGDTGYPSTVQLEDGTIVTLYYAVGNRREPQRLCDVGAFAASVFYREESL